MIRRTASGKAKKGMTLSQLRRQACAMAGYFRPQGPASKASSAALPASASLARWIMRSAGTTGFRSFHETNSSECRIRCTTQVWMIVSGKTALIASGNPFRPSTTAMRMSPTPRFLSSFMTRSQNLAPSVFSIHRPRMSLVPSAWTPRAMSTALLRTMPSSRILTRMASKKTATRLQRTVLPFRHGLQNRVRHRRDQIGGDVEPVELHEVALNLPRGHAARIHRHDLLVEAGEAALIPSDQLRIERPFPIAGNPDVELRGLCQNGLLRMPVAMVPPPRGGFALEMVVEFGVENTLGKRLLQLVEKPVLVENLFRVTAVQKLVQGVFLDRHKRPPSASLWPRTLDS